MVRFQDALGRFAPTNQKSAGTLGMQNRGLDPREIDDIYSMGLNGLGRLNHPGLAAIGKQQDEGGLRGPKYQAFRNRFDNDMTGPGSGLKSLLNPTPVGGSFLDQLNQKIAAQKGTVGQAPGGMQQPGGVSGGGGSSPWANVDRWNPQIESARQQVLQKTGVDVPTAVIKSIMQIESQGEFLAPNYAGYYGLMQVGPGSWGVGTDWDPNLAQTDPAYNIFAGTMELARRYEDAKRINPAYTWENVAVGYFSGHYEPNGSGDRWNSDFNYMNMFRDNMNQITSMGDGGSFGSGGAVVGGGQGVPLSAFSGGREFPVTQELGPTEFATGAGAWMYGYGAAYGITGHPGIDIGMPAGTPITSPWAGTVVCVGSQSYGDDLGGGGCGAYGDVGGGVGRVQVRLQNGDHVIFGHMRSTNLRPGDLVSAGQTVGLSGNMNGDHMHLEYRAKDGSLSSGFRVIDPRKMSGSYTMGGGQPQAQGFGTGGSYNPYQYLNPATRWGGWGYNR